MSSRSTSPSSDAPSTGPPSKSSASHLPSHAIPSNDVTADQGSLSAAANDSSSGSHPPISYLTWFKGVLGLLSQNEIQSFNAVVDAQYAETFCKRCERWRDWNFTNSPLVRFMVDETAALGGDFGPHNVHCRNCTGKQRGGFDRNYGILICANHESTRKKVEETMAHELVHAWDVLRWKVDNDDMRHQACTEIRASTLSGECRFLREFGRGNYRITKQFQNCVRYRATQSMLARPQITDEEHAKRVVNQVWGSCFEDIRPFDHIYR